MTEEANKNDAKEKAGTKARKAVKPLADGMRNVVTGDAISFLENYLLEHEDGGKKQLREEDDLTTSFVASMPDVSEIRGMTLQEWQKWFMYTAKLICQCLPPKGVAVFFQSDIRLSPEHWVDKSYLIQKAAEEAGCTLVWHKVCCRVPAGKPSYKLCGYSHIVCFSKQPLDVSASDDDNAGGAPTQSHHHKAQKEAQQHVSLSFDRSTADVMPQTGSKSWVKGTGSDVCVAIAKFLKFQIGATTVINPFCGEGQILAACNAFGMQAIGIEKSAKRCGRAATVLMARNGTIQTLEDDHPVDKSPEDTQDSSHGREKPIKEEAVLSVAAREAERILGVNEATYIRQAFTTKPKVSNSHRHQFNIDPTDEDRVVCQILCPAAGDDDDSSSTQERKTVCCGASVLYPAKATHNVEHLAAHIVETHPHLGYLAFAAEMKRLNSMVHELSTKPLLILKGDDGAVEDQGQQADDQLNSPAGEEGELSQKFVDLLGATEAIPDRVVVTGDALGCLQAALNQRILGPDASSFGPEGTRIALVASMPDASEFIEWPVSKWEEWFVQTAKLVLDSIPPKGVAVFFQSDIRLCPEHWVDKSYLIQKAAEEAGCTLVWHKVCCRVDAGKPSFKSSGYSHLLCFSRGDLLARAEDDGGWNPHTAFDGSTCDVIPDTGLKTWTRATGSDVCVAIAKFLKFQIGATTVINPFCGEGQILAACNAFGMKAIGIEKSGKRNRKALTVLMAKDGTTQSTKKKSSQHEEEVVV